MHGGIPLVRLSVRLSLFWLIWSVVLGVSGVVAYRNVQELSQAAGWVAHTHEVLEASQATLTTLTEAESGQRGFLITGDPVSLEPYRAALARLQEELGQVQALVRDNPRQGVLVQGLRELAGARLDELRMTLNLRDRDPEAARRAVLAHLSTNIMGSIRGQFEAMRREEQALLAGREQASRRAFRAALFSGMLSMGLGLLGMAALLGLVLRDASGRRKAASELAQSEERFRKLTELSPNAIWVNRNDRIELANPEACRLMGAAAADQLEGRSIYDIWHPDSHGKVRERLKAGISGRVVQRSEEAIVRLDGSVRTLEVSSAPFEDAHGFALQCVLTDVTERRQAERALRDSEDRFRRLFETAPVPYALFHRSGPTLALNQRFQETFGYTLEDVPTMAAWWRRAYPDPAALRESEQYWEAAARGAVGDTAVEMGGRRQVTCRDGTVRTVEVSALMHMDQVLATYFDLTDHLRQEEDRRRVEERMVQAQRLEALGVLVAGVAHNFNNILAVIMGTASMQELDAREPAQVEALRIIDTACQRGRGLVKSLTHFARPSVPNRLPIELGALIAEMRLLLGNTARRNIAIVEALAPGPAWILGDPGSFSSALMNLCLNSLDAMPDGGTLTLRTAIPRPDLVEISVEDTGEGMAPEVLARVTEPFFTTKAVDKGTGLGLSVAHGVVKAHGGTLEITSQPGRGTQVKLRMPRHLEPAPGAGAAPPPRSLGLAKVLVVDDEEDVRGVLVRMLTLAGAARVETVASGLEALASLEAGDLPDLVILDHNMPGLDGTRTLGLIRARHRELPVLIASGELDLQDREGFRQEKVGFIQKPFTLDEIREKLAELGVGAGPG